MAQNHGGSGDNVGGNKTTYVTVAIRWTIVAGLCSALLGWYLICGQPDKMPTANFEYYTEGTKNKIALANKPIKFKDLSKDAYTIKWTFPDGSTSAEKEVIQTCKYQGNYSVKLEAFSKNGKLVNEKVINCRVDAVESLDDAAKIKIIFEGRQEINMAGTILFETPPIRPSWCNNNKICEFFVLKGVQPYYISGNAINREGHCEINGGGDIEFIDGAVYRIYFTDISTCTVKMERTN